jgi:hypothetical protein
MQRADYCAVCGQTLDETSVQLHQRADRTLFCSLECLVTYAVGRIRQRLEQRNSQVRLFARQQKKLRSGAHSKRGGRSIA